MLDAAMRFGADKVELVCLWNGEGGDGPGGAQHMMEEVRQRGGRTIWLDTTKLWLMSARQSPPAPQVMGGAKARCFD